MTFAHPQALWFLTALPLVWVLAYLGRRHHRPLRLAGATLLRSVVFVLLAMALAQPRLQARNDGVSVVYALDVSRSVSSAFVRRSLDWIRATNARHRPAQSRYLVFGDRARLVASLDDVASVAVEAEGRSGAAGAIGQNATNLEQALRTATAGFGPQGARRLVLITDGNQTRGDVWRALPQLQAGRVRIYTVPAEPALARDAWIDAITVPPGVRQQEPTTVVVRVHALDKMAATVRLDLDAGRLGAKSVTLHPGSNDIAFAAVLPRAGVASLKASVRAVGDGYEGNDVLEIGVPVGRRPRVLYVEGMPESARYLADALRTHHIDVEVTGPEAFSAAVRSIASYDAVILSDVLVQTFDAKAGALLEAFVREQGGGLVFIAGESTYGQDGFAGSALERILPVRFEGKRKRRDLDLVLLIDRSHSMRGRKLELAKTAALSTLDLLEARHRLAVVAFDSRPHAVVPLAAVGNKRRAEDLISSMTARGQTSIHPAFAEARRLLKDSKASTKHIILLSDGVTAQPAASASGTPNAAEVQALIQKGREEAMRRDGIPVPRPDAAEPIPPPGAIEALVAELAEAGVTVSTVAIGERPNLALMGDIAAVGRGRSYVARSDAEIPGLFVAETRRLLGESIVEESFHPVLAHRVPALAGIDFAAGPPLRGQVIARAKAFSDVLLQGTGARPLLVTTHYGLGTTTAFLSDAKNRWSGEWIGWDGYGRFWAQVVRDTVPRRDDGDLALRVTRVGPESVVELRAYGPDQRHRNGLAPLVRVVDPDGHSAPLALRQVAPGQYQARLGLEPGHATPYRFELVAGGGLARGDVQAVAGRSLSYAWTDEFRALPPDIATLRALSEATGGVLAPDAAEIFALQGDGTLEPRPLWTYLVAAALVMFLLDVLWRRAPWPLQRLGRRRTGSGAGPDLPSEVGRENAMPLHGPVSRRRATVST